MSGFYSKMLINIRNLYFNNSDDMKTILHGIFLDAADVFLNGYTPSYCEENELIPTAQKFVEKFGSAKACETGVTKEAVASAMCNPAALVALMHDSDYDVLKEAFYYAWAKHISGTLADDENNGNVINDYYIPDEGSESSCDGEEVDLPNQMVIPDKVHDDVNAIGDYLSDETGFCHFGFGLVYEATVKVNRKDTKVINDLLSGKDLEWDADETHSINIRFRNGTNVDIMLCCPPESHADDPEGTPWTQARWYDSDEKEISCYCNDDTFFDDWAMTVENDPALSGPVSYMVHVIEE